VGGVITAARRMVRTNSFCELDPIIVYQEKFSKWSDAGSGVNPFTPFKRRQPATLPLKILRWVLGLALVAIRFLLLAVLLPVVFLLSSFFRLVQNNTAIVLVLQFADPWWETSCSNY
jgi:hypothetical protein